MPSADGLLGAFARTAGPTPIFNLSPLALSKLEEARSTPYKLGIMDTGTKLKLQILPENSVRRSIF